MAVGLTEPESIISVKGVRLAVTSVGVKSSTIGTGKKDLVLIELAEGSRCAAVFTQNTFRAAPVLVSEQHLAVTSPRYLLINSGNANAGTGARGLEDANACCQQVAAHTGEQTEAILPFSTGVIGEPLPVDRIVKGIPQLVNELREDGWLDAARAIMTTDTMAKGVSRCIELQGKTVTVSGIAKGSGMIRPDMATMLAYIATDAAISQPLLEQCLREAVANSFNSITVDSDTSTNDACVLIATGRAGNAVIETGGEDYQRLAGAVSSVCEQLAQAIVRDGEGATKFITVEVNSASAVAEARAVAYTIAHSPLVKTAFFAGDPNWGRILAAIGRAGVEQLDVNAVEIYLDGLCIVRDGGRADDYTEQQGQQVMKQPEITVRVEMGRGKCSARIWTTDLSYDYVRINAEYRT